MGYYGVTREEGLVAENKLLKDERNLIDAKMCCWLTVLRKAENLYPQEFERSGVSEVIEQIEEVLK